MQRTQGVVWPFLTIALAGCGESTWRNNVLEGSGEALEASLVTSTAQRGDEPGLERGTRTGIVPVRTGDESPAGPSSGNLTYRGGPILTNVEVVTVYWGRTAKYTRELNRFYRDTTNSAYMDWLSEYNARNYKIGRGKITRSILITNPPGGPNIDDKTVQNELANLVHRNYLPVNTSGNVLFMVHFAPGISITMNGDKSCEVFCGYHGTFLLDGKLHYYGVLPDHGGSCANGCSSDLADQLQRTTVTTSHELIEAVTDPGVGLADQDPSKLGWYDDQGGEIGDICNAQSDQVGAWRVQLEWSNANGACIATAP